FLGYLVLISFAPDVRRVFQYHDAEHMSIHALEAGDPLVLDAVRRYPTAHQRWRTEFLVIVVMHSIIAFSLVGRQPPHGLSGRRAGLARAPREPAHRPALAERAHSPGLAQIPTGPEPLIVEPAAPEPPSIPGAGPPDGP